MRRDARGRPSRSAELLLAAALAWTASAGLASAQTNKELWADVTIDWLKTSRLTYELSIEPKVLLDKPSGDPDWATIDATPNVQYAVRGWLDVVGEVYTAYTAQTNDVNSTEITPRAGVHLHLFSREMRVIDRERERPPKRRIVLRDLARVEARTLLYSDPGHATSHTVRFRNRLEFVAPLNKEKLTADRTRYFLADWEWFIPLDDTQERFANKQRIRSGFGYRRNLHWRFEGLYVWGRSRTSVNEAFDTYENAIELKIKRVF